ncbi:hypothetical protein LJC58_10205, partial [Lachnospiraceae bacterium OttesenSCG-928-D06]|nr:hypothetical protein [Lachnospiraceae bacterium OttesenSCG-928-D06]
EAYEKRLEQVTVKQNHEDGGSVVLEICAEVSGESRAKERPEEGGLGEWAALISITSPRGEEWKTQLPFCHNKAIFTQVITKPMLWWCNGLGGQPLYQVEVSLVRVDRPNRVMDSWKRKVGLRVIELDTQKDKWGNNFCFRINKVPIFAKGANWIPADSFITRTTDEDVRFYIESAKYANMNMLRVWGGGYYEKDIFYELCDENGILVWQDFAFACKVYPFDSGSFRENVKAEVQDNVRRLRHHACLALWCGNNEILMMSPMWSGNKEMGRMVTEFFFEALPGWLALEDSAACYWPGSPSSGNAKMRANNFGSGDTHLWQIWHGLARIETFQKYPTRFCSEYGLESLPSMKAIRSFTDSPNPRLLDEELLAHQKSRGGNEKMLYYLLAKYHRPQTIEDYVYLTQLTQSQAVRCATEGWRRDMGRSNGSLYWQYNDCWPVASWSSIDYKKQYKALQYQAKHFHAPIYASAEIGKSKAVVWLINEIPESFCGRLKWELASLAGESIASGYKEIVMEDMGAKGVMKLPYGKYLKKYGKRNAVLLLILEQDGIIISESSYLFVPDKKAKLHNPELRSSMEIKEGKAVLTIQTAAYARSVYVEIEGVDSPLSDNFFDIPGGEEKVVTFPVGEKMDVGRLKKSVALKSMWDIKPAGGRWKDIWFRVSMRLRGRSIRAFFVTRV